MDPIDPKDTVFLAAALSIQDSAIWSNDKHLKAQLLKKCFNTTEIIKLFTDKSDKGYSNPIH